MQIEVGTSVKVKPGATAWLKERGHWADYISEEIDGMSGVVYADYRHLKGENARVSVQLGFQYPVSIPEFMLELI